MGFGQTFENAGAIITLIGLLPAAVIVFIMSRNMTNSDFDMMAAFTAGVESIVQAIIPALGLTLVLAIVIFIARSGDF